MDFLVYWIPTIAMGFFFVIAGVILWIWNVRAEREAHERKTASPSTKP